MWNNLVGNEPAIVVTKALYSRYEKANLLLQRADYRTGGILQLL